MAYNPPMMDPMLVPTMQSIGMPASSNTLNAPIWATPFAPPPLNTTPTRLRRASAGDASNAKSNVTINMRQILTITLTNIQRDSRI